MPASMRGLLALALLLPLSARAQPAPTEGDVVLQDMHIHASGTMPTLKLHYETLGTPQKNAQGEVTNAVLLLHGTTGTGRQFLQPDQAGSLFGPGQVLDAGKYFIVLPDGIGAGGSSKPSDGLHGAFPRYGYLDQVDAQARLLGEIGIRHLRLVLGTSMGGMQAWLWAELHPDVMDATVAIAATPAPVAGRNMLWREMVLRAITDDPNWQGGRYDAGRPPTLWRSTAAPLFTIMTGNADVLQAAAPTREAAVRFFDEKVATLNRTDASDYFHTFDSSFDYDPSEMLPQITGPFLALNFRDDLLNPAESDVLPKAVAQLRNGRYVLLPGGFGHQSLTHAALWAPEVAAFLKQTANW